jgi:hypothetical protein
MKNIIFLMATFLCSFGMTQDLGLHFGHQMFSVFNSGTQLHGLSFGIDIPRNANITPYGQFTAFLPKKSEGLAGIAYHKTDFSSKDIYGVERTASYAIEIGTIYYLGDAYDYGLSFTLHSSMRLLLNPIKTELKDYDPFNYDFFPISENYNETKRTGATLYSNFGIGVKQTFGEISIYGMVGIDILLLGVPPAPFYLTNFMGYHTRIGVRYPIDSIKNAQKRQERKEARQQQKQNRKSW